MADSFRDNFEFIIIVGSPRSGTTWLQYALGGHPQIASHGSVELRHFSHYLAPLLAAWDEEYDNLKAERWEQGLPTLWDEKQFEEFLDGFTQSVYQPLVEKTPGATHILDKYPGYTFHMDAINRVLPKVKFIHLIRDGRDVILSMQSAKQRVGFGTDNIWRASQEWVDHVSAARETGAKLGAAHYLEIRYEDLVASPEELLTQVYDFCGVTLENADLSEIVGKINLDRQRLSSANPDRNTANDRLWESAWGYRDRYVVEEITGALLRQLQYTDTADWWARSSTERLKISAWNLLRKIKRGVGR
ncbi:MAG: sulfotransferase [Bacteroidota bacterium]